jgi:hypothetical protein
MGKNNSEYWPTKQEKDFISQLGVTLCINTPRYKLLKQYRETMKLRADWGQVDREEIAAFVDRAIEEEAGCIGKIIKKSSAMGSTEDQLNRLKEAACLSAR